MSHIRTTCPHSAQIPRWESLAPEARGVEHQVVETWAPLESWRLESPACLQAKQPHLQLMLDMSEKGDIPKSDGQGRWERTAKSASGRDRK